ncbi:MAG TPA: CHAT domain-containing protein, partial [Candidatus Angelobacter sp.]
HEASGAANKNLQAGNADPRWLQIQGRALLWQSTPSSLEKAAKDFEKARSRGLATPSLEIDLAASYFERDSRTEHPNLQRTLNLLSEVLSKPNLSKEDHASALFNLAIAYEKTEAWDLAVETWEKYLQVDSTSGWAGEARQHLKDAQRKVSLLPQKYSDPSFFLQQKAQGTLRPEDPEQYQQKALSEWLPAAATDKNSDAYRALSSLADVLSNEHSDQWMKAFLALMSPSESEGTRALSAAVAANEGGRYDVAIPQSEIAEEIFRTHKNVPGQLFAQFEWVYAKRSFLHAEECLARANPLWEALSSTKYRWLQGQVALERAQCKNFLGELSESDSDSAMSLTLAQRSHFPVLELRVFGISASMHLQQGRCDGAWEQGVEGLKRYWEGIYPRDRLDQFYAVLWQCTEESGSLYAARDVLQHTLALRRIAPVRNPFREAMLHLRLRNIFLSQKQHKLAESEDEAASSLLADLKDKKIDLTEYRLINDIEPAELQLQQGDPETALATIKRVSSNLKTVQDDFITMNVNRVSGNIDRELGNLDEAKSEYQNAINIAETTLKSLKDGEDRLKWLKATDDSYRGLVRVLLAQKKAEEALEKWEWYQSRPLLQGFRATDVPSSATESSRNQGKSSRKPVKAPGETRLVYANFKDGLQIWTSNEKGVQSTWVKVKQQDFERTVRDFSERCATPDSKLSELREEGTWLYAQLLQPIIASLPESQAVIVELDRSAYNLSMEALTSPAGWYFGEKYPVAYSPGTRMEQALRISPSLGLDAELLLLDASHTSGSTYLPGMEAQRNLISHLFPRTHIVDSSTTRWNEIHSLLALNQIFHYIGHGRRDGSGTSLVLNTKDSLRATDIDPRLFARSQLVVLAACSTAIGRESGLLDTNSLVRAFLTAGVPSVVASHWDVDSASTSRLMINFYQNIAAGQSIVQAIYLARKEILVDRPHPYYWASFSLTGRLS